MPRLDENITRTRYVKRFCSSRSMLKDISAVLTKKTHKHNISYCSADTSEFRHISISVTALDKEKL